VTSSDEPQRGRGEQLVRHEEAEDHEAVRDVHTQAFGGSEPVPALVDALRAASPPLAPVSLVATIADRVVGHMMLSACRLDALPRPSCVRHSSMPVR
jgi:putative acetyltransferase